jgi:hypothetical protein
VLQIVKFIVTGILILFAHLLTYLCTELSLSWEAANCATIQEIPSNFKEPESSSQCSQEPSTGPYPEPVRSSPHHPNLSLRSILILSTHLRLGLPSGFFPSGFPTNILYAFLVSPIRATWPAHLIIIDLSILTQGGICRVNTFFSPVACCFLYKAKHLAALPPHNLKYTWHLGRQMSHLSVQTQLDSFFKPEGRAITREVSRRLPTAAALVRARVKSCGIFGGKNDTGAGFLRVLLLPLHFAFHRLLDNHRSLSSEAGHIIKFSI